MCELRNRALEVIKKGNVKAAIAELKDSIWAEDHRLAAELIRMYNKAKHRKSLELQRRTEMFWALQIQFMELSDYALCNSYVSITDQAKLTDKQNKNYRLALTKLGFALSPDEKACLATSLAVHLSGVEEE
jgi:hypothetical protein